MTLSLKSSEVYQNRKTLKYFSVQILSDVWLYSVVLKWEMCIFVIQKQF